MFADLLAPPGGEEVCALGSRFGLRAFPGGTLERGTDTIARAAAERAGASLYAVVQPGDLSWHVPAHEIAPDDAPSLAAFLEHVDIVLSLHGYLRPDLHTALLLGGSNRVLAEELGRRLRAALPEYEVICDLPRIPPSLRGVHPSNPVNLSRGGGVQLELPHPVRSIGPFRAESYRRHAATLGETLAGYAAAVA